MNYGIITIGSRGDIEPFIALGKGLLKRGHHVRITTFVKFQEYIESSGFEYCPLAGDAVEVIRLLIGEQVSSFEYFRKDKKRWDMKRKKPKRWDTIIITALMHQTMMHQNRDAELSALFKRTYEDNVLGRITNEQFRMLSTDYNSEQNSLKDRIPQDLQYILPENEACRFFVRPVGGLLLRHTLWYNRIGDTPGRSITRSVPF